MKNLILLVAMITFSYTMTAQTATKVALVETAEVVKKKAALIKWDKKTYQFGEIPQGKPVTAEFEITNSSKEEMIIISAKASCGCTLADYQKTPIAPGESTIIKATYNAAKAAPFTKSVTVRTNLKEQPDVLMIRGTVVAKK